MTIKRSYVWAVVIAIGLGLWILSGQFGGPDPAETDTAGANGDTGAGSAIEQGSAEGVPADARPAQSVRARIFEAEPVLRDVVVRGRTEPVRAVEVRAETSGTVVELPKEKGEYVAEGDLLCRLDVAARDAKLAEAKALRQQRWLQYDASRKLAARGHRSETQAAADKAAYDAAVAQVKQMEVELAYTQITAPFEGVLDARAVELGDFLSLGQTCATVVDLDPILIVGQISERDVGKITMGTVGRARLVSGETIEGVVRFIAKTAEEATRTFRVELEVPNADRALRAGLTAEIVVPAAQVMGHRMSPAFLVLNDAGTIGVRTVDDDGRVDFRPVDIIEDGNDGVWVTGLPEQARVITVGQEFVREGMRVDVTLEQEGSRS